MHQVEEENNQRETIWLTWGNPGGKSNCVGVNHVDMGNCVLKVWREIVGIYHDGITETHHRSDTVMPVPGLLCKLWCLSSYQLIYMPYCQGFATSFIKRSSVWYHVGASQLGKNAPRSYVFTIVN